MLHEMFSDLDTFLEILNANREREILAILKVSSLGVLL